MNELGQIIAIVLVVTIIWWICATVWRGLSNPARPPYKLPLDASEEREQLDRIERNQSWIAMGLFFGDDD